MTKSEVFDFLSRSTNNQFISNALFEACVEDALDTKYIKNGVQYTPSIKYIVRRAISNCKTILNFPNIYFRDIYIADHIHNKEEYLSQLSLLENVIEL